MRKIKLIYASILALVVCLVAMIALTLSLWLGIIEQIKENPSILRFNGSKISFSPVIFNSFDSIYLPNINIHTSSSSYFLSRIKIHIDYSAFSVLEHRLPVDVTIDKMTVKYRAFQALKESPQNTPSKVRQLKHLALDTISLKSIVVKHADINLQDKPLIKVHNLKLHPIDAKRNHATFELERISLENGLAANHLSGDLEAYRDHSKNYHLTTRIKTLNQPSNAITAKISSDFKEAEISSFSQLPFKWTSLFFIKPMQQTTRLSIRKRANNALTYRSITKIDDIILSHPTIADQPLNPLSMSFELKGVIDLNQKTSRHYSTVSFNRTEDETVKSILKARTNISLEQLSEKRTPIIADIWLSATPCRKLFSTLPKNLLTDINTDHISGNIAGHIAFAINLKPNISFSPKSKHMSYNCNLSDNNQLYSRDFLVKRKLPHTYDLKSLGLKPQVANFISNDFTTDLGFYVPFALIAAEDTGFLSHDGIELGSILSAAKQNLQQGEFAVGGSTITMQLAKNLYLTSSKHISRKLQEIILAFYLESKLTKREILNIYANIIEYGPGLFGISGAAKQLFDKQPKDLNLEESLYLASSLPNPTKHIANFCSNEISADMLERMTEVYQRYKALTHRYGKSTLPLDFSTIQFYKGSPYRTFACPKVQETIAFP